MFSRSRKLHQLAVEAIRLFGEWRVPTVRIDADARARHLPCEFPRLPFGRTAILATHDDPQWRTNIRD
ncbi:MAG: hypothetical protein RL580_683, partial [Pseudomonadota bacterium]